MEKIKFYDLTPVNDVDLDIYKEAINYSLENDKIKNIAISGGYGAGKSSLLESYKIEEKDKRFLHISLSHFKELNNKDNENNETIAVANLEAKILNQLIHQIPEDAIPQTHFKIKRKFTNREIYLATSLVLIFGVALSHIIYFNKWKTFILKLRLCHNKQLINSHFYRGVSELPYKLLFAVIYTHLEFRYEMSHTITSHHVHHFHQTRIPDGTLLDYMVQYRKPLFPQFFLYPKKFLPENNPHHKEFHLRPYIQNNANQ